MSSSDTQSTTTGSAAAQHLPRQLNLRDLVLSQVLTVVGSAWVGIAAGLGHAQTVVWLLAFGAFYLPMAAAVYHLNREMPLEGGLYVWARRAFGDTAGFLVAWNIWAYALSTIATILFQIPSEFAYMVGPRAAWIPENHLAVFCFLAVVLTADPRAVLGAAATRAHPFRTIRRSFGCASRHGSPCSASLASVRRSSPAPRASIPLSMSPIPFTLPSRSPPLFF